MKLNIEVAGINFDAAVMVLSVIKDALPTDVSVTASINEHSRKPPIYREAADDNPYYPSQSYPSQNIAFQKYMTQKPSDEE